MSFDKTIQHGKEYPRSYDNRATDADRACRNHSSCAYCARGRQHKLMSFDKVIQYGREYRKPYYNRVKDADRTCRNHGSCAYCARGGQHKHKRRRSIKED